MSQKEYENELKTVVEGVEAVVRTAKHLRNGDLTLERLRVAQIKNWVGVVLTIDEYFLVPRVIQAYSGDGKNHIALNSAPIRNHLIQLCYKAFQKSNFVEAADLRCYPEGQIQVVSIDDFEQHLAAVIKGFNRLSEIATGQIRRGVHPTLGTIFDTYVGSVKFS
jgi:hypothetical protein